MIPTPQPRVLPFPAPAPRPLIELPACFICDRTDPCGHRERELLVWWFRFRMHKTEEAP